MLHEEVEVGALAEKMGVVGGDGVDDKRDFAIVFPGSEQLAVGIEILEAQLHAPLAQATGEKLLLMFSEMNPAIAVDQLCEKGVRLFRNAGVRGHPWSLFSWTKNP